jgi:hypothetical protein
VIKSIESEEFKSRPNEFKNVSFTLFTKQCLSSHFMLLGSVERTQGLDPETLHGIHETAKAK